MVKTAVCEYLVSWNKAWASHSVFCLPFFSCTLNHEECRKVRVRTVKLRIPQNLGPTYESYDCETFSVVLE